MEKIKQSELVVGRLYCDSSTLNGFNAVVMQFTGEQEGKLVFKYISGVNEYINNGDGLIKFARYKKEPNYFWELEPEMQDVLIFTPSNP